MHRYASLLLIAFCLTGGVAYAATGNPGDLLVAGYMVTGFPYEPGWLEQYSSSGERIGTIANLTGTWTEIRPTHLVQVGADQYYVDGALWRVAGGGRELVAVHPGPYDPHTPNFFNGLAVDRAGNFYLSEKQGAHIYKFDTSGKLLTTYELPDAAPWFLDLSADQCTLLYTSNAGVGRFDLCANQPLSALPVPMGEIHVLYDGTLLVRYTQSVQHFAADGTLLKTFPVTGFGYTDSVAPDVGGQAFWVASQGGVMKLSLSTGAVLAGPVTIVHHFGPDVDLPLVANTMMVAGAPRAAQLPATGTAVPTLGVGLWVLAFGLIAVALVRFAR